MKKLALILAVAFTMGLAASTVTASTVNDDKKKTECTSTEKKECSKDKKACCSSEKKAETTKTEEKAK